MSLPSLRKTNLQSTETSSHTGPVDLEVQPRCVLHSKLSGYELQYLRFTGCFSKVAQCKDVDTKDVVAVKIFKKWPTDSLEPNRELAMLKRIRGLDPENIVRFLEDFEHKGHTCLVFEMLDKNLHEMLKERHDNRLPLLEIRPIAQQLLTALESLKTVGVIHANIKPQNIMLTRQKQLRVKLIDFGSAIAAAEVKRGVIMQPVAYRSPDVILGLPISEAVDVWSLGGVLATMFLGSLPFPQRCQYYQVKTMVETLGQPEDTLLNDGAHTRLYFRPNQDSTMLAWRLNTVEEYTAATGFPPQEHRGSSTRFNYLNDLVILNPEENVMYKMRFVSLLRAMLRLSPQKRITPSDALRHPFITLYGEEAVVPAAAEPSNSDVEDVPALRFNDASVGAAVSAQANSGDAPAMTGVNEVSAGYEASDSTTSERETLTSESVRAVAAGGEPDAVAGSAGDDDEAAASPAPMEALAAPVTIDLGGAVSADEGTGTADEASTAPPVSEPDDGAVYSPSDTADADGVSATGSRNRWAERVRRFFGRVFRALCCCCCCCAANVEQ